MNRDQYPLQLAEGLWVLGHPYYNLYLVKGKKESALVETGVSAIVDDVARQLERLNASPSFLIVLHPHPDHINGLPGLRELFPNARVVAGPGAPEFISHPRTAQSLIAEDSFMSEFLEKQGHIFRRPPLDSAPSLAGCIVKREGEIIDLNPTVLRFMEARGHAIGGLAVHIPQFNAVIASDSLGYRLPGGGDFFPIYFTGYKEYMATIDRLQLLNPAILGLAHHGVVTGGEDISQAFWQARRCAREIHEMICNDPRSDEEIIEDIFTMYYRDELKSYTRQNIITCCKLLIKRSREAGI